MHVLCHDDADFCLQLAKNYKREEVIPLVDPRGSLPSIETIRRNAEFLRQSSVRRSDAGSAASGENLKLDTGTQTNCSYRK